MEQQVTFAGWISGGMDRFYSALDINALTSLSETFPYALTEGPGSTWLPWPPPWAASPISSTRT